jgi:hypothetical protein
VDLSLSLSDDCDNTIFSVRSFPALQRLSLEGPGIGSQSDLEAWLHACPAAIDVWIPDYFILDSLMEQIADGRLLPRVQILAFGSAIPAHLIAALEARQRSTACSTIVETGLTSDGVEHWELQASEKMGIASLRMMGVFVARCEASTRPRLGQVRYSGLAAYL